MLDSDAPVGATPESTEATPAATPPRRRRAASRPAGPPKANTSGFVICTFLTYNVMLSGNRVSPFAFAKGMVYTSSPPVALSAK